MQRYLFIRLSTSVSDSGTTNGVGRFNGGPEVPWSVVNVTAGKRYRFRVINQSARNVFTMSFENHTVTVGVLYFTQAMLKYG